MADSGIRAVVKNYPVLITIALIILVSTHAVLTFTGTIPDTWHALLGQQTEDILAIYLGASSAAAIVAGFAGVVVIFGLTANGERFRILRATAGDRLGDNWTSTSVSGFSAAGLCLLASVFHAAGLSIVGPWLFELGLLLLIHGTIRIIWLLRELMKVVTRDDEDALRKAEERPLSPDSFS